MVAKINKCPSCGKKISSEEKGICHFCKHFLNPDVIEKGEKVTYAPNKSSMVRAITDNAYELHGFTPGDVLTVDSFETDEGGFRIVLVKEIDSAFSPFELIPESEINEAFLKNMLNEYNKLIGKYGR